MNNVLLRLISNNGATIKTYSLEVVNEDSGIALGQILGILIFVWWILIGGFSHTLLVGAVLKAHKISPTRGSNFATRFIH